MLIVQKSEPAQAEEVDECFHLRHTENVSLLFAVGQAAVHLPQEHHLEGCRCEE